MTPPVTAFGQAAYDWLEPVQADDADRGFPLMVLCGAVGEMFREVEELVRARPGRQPWQQAFDIDNAPDFQLPWLGQMVGVSVTANLPADQQRDQVRAEGGFKRGRPATLVANVQTTLTGTQRVRLTERTADAWTMLLTTDPGETPDSVATNRVAQAAKVAGLLLTVVQSSTPLIDEGTRTLDASTATIDTAALSDIT